MRGLKCDEKFTQVWDVIVPVLRRILEAEEEETSILVCLEKYVSVIVRERGFSC